jgi:hypothetical protein
VKLCCTEVVLDIKVGSKLGAGLNIGLDTKLGLGLELGTGLDRELCTVLILDIKLGSKLGTGLDRVRRTVLGVFPQVPVLKWKYITGMDRRSVRGQTVFALMHPFNARYAVKHPFLLQF